MQVNKPIKILQILEATVGGTRKHLIFLLREIDREQFDIHVAAPKVRHGDVEDTDFTQEVFALDVPIHFVDMRRGINLWADLKALLNLYALIRKEKYDVVHTHSSKAGFVGRIAAALHSVPTIYTPNGFYFLDAKSTIKRLIFLWLEKFAGLFTNKLIAVSDSEEKTVIENGIVSSNRVTVIPNAIDPEPFEFDLAGRQRVRAELGLTEETLIVGTVSRYIPQKDPLTLVQTAKLVLEVLPEIRFVWCGEGEMREETEALAKKLGIHSVFHFLGFRSDVKDIMNTFDVFLLSSIFEGLPYTLLEAMALGLPLVTTDVVGSRDVIVNGENGLLVPPKSPQKLADALLDLLQNPQKRQYMGSNGRQLLLQKYNLKKAVLDTQSIYQDLTSKTR